MRTLIIGSVALAFAASFAQAGQTQYIPHPATGASRVAFQDPSDEPCSKDREILACVVQLGPGPGDRWAYFLADNGGQRSEAVKFDLSNPGSPCAAMAYPAGNVQIVGGASDWFAGKVERACRR